MRTAPSPNCGRRLVAPRTLIAPAVLATALLGTAAVGVIAGRPVAALSTANQTASKAKTSVWRWRVVARVGPYGDHVSGTPLTAHSAKDAWSIWAGARSTAVERLVGTGWKQVPLPAKLTDYVRSTVGFDGDSATDFWLFDAYRKDSVLRFTGGKWTLQQIPSWVLPVAGGGELSGVTPTAFGPGNVWVFNSSYAYAAHYNGHAWAKVKLPLVPNQVSAVGPDDIWAIAARGANVAWHWNGKTWTAIKIPKATTGNTPEIFGPLIATGPESAWVWRTVLAPTPHTDAEVLHWNGKSWQKVAGTPADNLISVAPDGSGGLWVIGTDLYSNDVISFYHLTGDRWTKADPPAGVSLQDFAYLTWIPGTRSLWGTATADSSKGSDGALIKYGP
jgi:hypothetical protein